MLRIFLWEVKRHWRDYYLSPVSYLIEFFSIFIGVAVYWYTAQAFKPNASVFLPNQDFFSYVLIGELSLMIPMGMLIGPTRLLTRNAAENTLEP